MKRSYFFSLAIAAIGSATLSLAAANANGFGHGGRHHGSAAARACIAVMNHDQRSSLKSIFSADKSTLMGDHQKLMADKQALSEAILSKNSDLSTLEANVSTDKQKLLQEQDAIAVKICGTLSSQQLSAAQGLYKNMLALRQSTHQQAREYFKQARSAAGNSTTSQVPGDTQNAE